MRLTPPKKNVFYISVALAVLGLLGRYLQIPFLSDYYFYFVLVGYIVLALGNTLKGF
jgi:hypothetical protein